MPRGIWAGGRFASNQDVAGLFFARCVDLYLGQRGLIGFVMPHSALQSGQHSRWRTGKWVSPPIGRGKARASAHSLSVEFNYKRAWDLEQLDPNTFFPIASCVVFARSTGNSGVAEPLAGKVEVWQGKPGSPDVVRASRRIAEFSGGSESPYADYSRQGASIRPRRFFFVQETENTAVIQAGNTVTVNPRRGTQDKAPWRELDLSAITGQTVEGSHLFDIHLGETVAPYVTLDPLKALLPVKQNEYRIPSDDAGIGGIRSGGLEQRMSSRWQTINRWWEDNKAPVNKLNLLERVDYHGVLSSQLSWQREKASRPVRVLQSEGGRPTAAILQGDTALVDETLYWITCRDLEEANYLLAIINSDSLYEGVEPLMAKGQFGARHLHKHLWKLPIPEFNPRSTLHTAISRAGKEAAAGAARRLTEIREERGPDVSVTIVRRELRRWLKSSKEGGAVESYVSRLLSG